VANGALILPIPRTGVAPTGTQVEAVQAELDLRPYTVLRSDQAAAEPPPVSLPGRVARLTILLPVGSEPGAYEIQVLSSELRSRASAHGEATIRDFVTTLEATIDLRSLQPGTHELAVRRQGDGSHRPMRLVTRLPAFLPPRGAFHKARRRTESRRGETRCRR
jgi:hypothetical protein